MDRRLVSLAAVGIVVGATLAGAAFFLGVPRVRLTDSPSEADQVTLYQNGLAFVELHRAFDAGPGQVALVFSVPMTTIFDSLVVQGDGVQVLELRSALAAVPWVQPGDEVTIHVAERTYRGTVLATDNGQVALSTPQGTTLVDASKIEAIEMAGKPARESGPGSAEVTALVQAASGARSVRLSYLASGPGWSPSYRMGLADGAFAFEATLTGLYDWQNVSLDLVSGSPNVVASYQPPSPQPVFRVGAAMDAAGAPSGSGGGIGPSTQLGELHRYHLERPITLARGETVRLPVLEGKVEVLRHYFEAQGSTGFGGYAGARSDLQVLERAELKNTLTEPLPPGVVRFYRDDTWIGEDMLPATPRNDTANVTLARSEEVHAKVVLSSFEARSDRDRSTYTLTVENLRTATDPIDLRATLSIPSYRTNVLSVEPAPDEQNGGQVAWNAEVAQGKTATFRVTFETLRGP